jgi:hypothetical protein
MCLSVLSLNMLKNTYLVAILSFVRLGIPFGSSVLHVFGSLDPVIQVCPNEIDLI